MVNKTELTSSTGKVFLTVECDAANNWVYNCWNGYVSPENVMQGCLAVLEAFQNQRSVSILNDNSQLVGRWDDSVEWIEKEWIPRALKAGLRYFAHVANQESFAAASAAQLSSRTHGLFEMRIFGDLEQAQNWLKERQQAKDSHL
jgi:hypothetical protein